MIDRLRELLRADGVTAGPWVAGWWTGQAESMCNCASKGPLLGKRPQTQYPGAGPFHIHATDFLADTHYISGPAPLCEGVAGNYDYEQGGIMDEADAALIVEAVNALPGLLDAHDRMAGALRRSVEVAHDFALMDADRGFDHSATPWMACPAELCETARAALGGVAP